MGTYIIARYQTNKRTEREENHKNVSIDNLASFDRQDKTRGSRFFFAFVACWWGLSEGRFFAVPVPILVFCRCLCVCVCVCVANFLSFFHPSTPSEYCYLEFFFATTAFCESVVHK
ncbi:hypothetical protein F5H01DRAFT_204698 [Linnemannia elongata]|nr:hypothetical protein F5H01DRAFT_204698 [Linnemannia elongata]